MTNRHVSLVDYARTACLCAASNADYLAALVVEADGTERLVLVEKASIGDPDAGYNAACPDAPHEQTGPLPSVFKRRVYGDPRCGAPTTSGRPCRHKVRAPGDRCSLHRRCESCGELAATATPPIACGPAPPTTRRRRR